MQHKKTKEMSVNNVYNIYDSYTEYSFLKVIIIRIFFYFNRVYIIYVN